MADTIERLYKITVDGAEAVRQLTKIADSTGSLEEKFNKVGESVKKFAEVLGVSLGAKEIIDRVKETTEAFDALGKEAAKVGVGVEALQKLKYAAGFASVSSEELDKALTKVSVGITNLADGTDAAAQTLRALGVNGGDSAAAALDKIADRFAKMPDGAQKTAEAVALFGEKIGVNLIPLLNGGAKALHEAGDEARALRRDHLQGGHRPGRGVQ